MFKSMHPQPIKFMHHCMMYRLDCSIIFGVLQYMLNSVRHQHLLQPCTNSCLLNGTGQSDRLVLLWTSACWRLAEGEKSRRGGRGTCKQEVQYSPYLQSVSPSKGTETAANMWLAYFLTVTTKCDPSHQNLQPHCQTYLYSQWLFLSSSQWCWYRYKGIWTPKFHPIT